MIRFEYPSGATPLDPDEANGLKQTWLATQADLNAIEQENIARAHIWLAKVRKVEPLNEKFIRDLHRHMFGEVWQWAGQFRRSDKNIGVEWRHIPVRLRQLLDDVGYWIANSTYDSDEIAARFHHRLVAIHCFANGNGRHARLAADTLLKVSGATLFSWGSKSLGVSSNTRRAYISALRHADEHRYEDLIRFVRS